MKWTLEEKQIVRENWGRLSAREISDLLFDRSRCAVIGQAHRMHLPELKIGHSVPNLFRKKPASKSSLLLNLPRLNLNSFR